MRPADQSEDVGRGCFPRSGIATRSFLKPLLPPQLDLVGAAKGIFPEDLPPNGGTIIGDRFGLDFYTKGPARAFLRAYARLSFRVHAELRVRSTTRLRFRSPPVGRQDVPAYGGGATPFMTPRRPQSSASRCPGRHPVAPGFRKPSAGRSRSGYRRSRMAW